MGFLHADKPSTASCGLYGDFVRWFEREVNLAVDRHGMDKRKQSLVPGVAARCSRSSNRQCWSLSEPYPWLHCQSRRTRLSLSPNGFAIAWPGWIRDIEIRGTCEQIRDGNARAVKPSMTWGNSMGGFGRLRQHQFYWIQSFPLLISRKS